MKRAFFLAAFLAALSLGLSAGTVLAQCPPGTHFVAGRGCLQNPPPPIPPAELRRVAARRLNVRRGPAPQAPPVAVLSRGTPVRILAAEGAWVRIRVPQSGIEGWALRRFISY